MNEMWAKSTIQVYNNNNRQISILKYSKMQYFMDNHGKWHDTFNKTLIDTKHIKINIYINLINCTKT